MTTREIVDDYVSSYPGTLVTPTIVKAWALARHGAASVSVSAIADAMRTALRPHGRGVYVAQAKPLSRPSGQLFAAAALVASFALAGCSGISRRDQVQIRELRAGTASVVSIVVDPVTGVSCWISWSGMWCDRPAPESGQSVSTGCYKINPTLGLPDGSTLELVR